MPDPQRTGAERLSASWDAVVQGEASHPGGVDPEMADLIHRLHARYRPPRPDARLRTQLRKDLLMSAAANVHPPAPHGAVPLLPARRAVVTLPGESRTIRGARHGAPRGSVALFAAVAGVFLFILTLSSLVPSRFWAAPGDEPLLQFSAITPSLDAGTPAPDAPVAFVWQATGGPDRPLTGAGLLALDPQGNVWVPDSYANQFQILAPDGSFVDVWGTPGSDEGELNLVTAGFGLGAVAFDADGNLYVADSGNYRIQKFDPQRRFMTAWGSQGAKDGQFLRPLSVTVDSQGRVFVGDDLRGDIQVFDRDGAYLATWGGKEAGEGRLNGPSGMAFDPDGNVWVADYNNNRIVAFSPDGAVLAAWGTYGNETGELFEPQSLAVDAQGRVYVAEFGNYRVQVFDSRGQVLDPGSQGKPLAVWGESGRGDGQFDGIYGIALDDDGNLYTSEILNPRVQKFRLLPPLAP